MKVDCDLNDLDDLIKKVGMLERDLKGALTSAGEAYVSTARVNGSYKDKTGNLRNANGYWLAEKGQLIGSNAASPLSIEKIAGLINTNDLALVVGNNMEYASYVEAKGYDVASSGHLAAERVLESLVSKIKP